MAQTADKEEVVGYYNSIKEDNPDMSPPLAALKALVRFLESNKMVTISEFNDRLDRCIAALSESESKHSSIHAGCQLFLRFITLTNMQFADFERCRQNMIHRANHWVNKMANARQTIARLAEPFISHGTIVLTHSYSRVVMEAFKEAVSKGKMFKVYVTESQPNKSGYRTAEELKKLGLPVTVILDSAVGYKMEEIALVVVGAEHLVNSGGILNKIGTFNIAMAAKMYNKPFYVMAESLKYLDIFPIEQSDIPAAIKYKIPDYPEDKEGDTEDRHPLIDYTPPKYINRLISDIGVLPPGAIVDEMLSLYH
ncbi:translation initiation factor eIF2B subunit alpha-like [Littorina saxatilis]|uniref:Translation initiation factor eIF2B subunit alpha n=1 Tax=Littorina saxatilis TaxID=31220 RepID=A0AAN9FWC3_9CAEN